MLATLDERVVYGRSFETPVSICHGPMFQLFNDLQLYGWRVIWLKRSMQNGLSGRLW